MKKMYFVIGCSLFLFSSVCLAEKQPVMEGGQRKYQTQFELQSASSLTEVMTRHKFSRKNMSQVLAVVAEMQNEKLPVKPIISKVREGLAKNVEPDIIVQAVEKVQDRYQRAYRQAFKLSNNVATVRKYAEVIAKAFTAGLTEEKCSKITTELLKTIGFMEGQKGDQLATETLLTTRNMLRRGVSATTTSDVVISALHQSFDASAMKQLQHTFERESKYGYAEHVAKQFANDIAEGLTAGELGQRNGNSGYSDGSSGGSGNSSDTSGGSNNAGGSSGGSGNSSDTSGGSGNSGGSSSGSGNSSDASGGSGNSGGSSSGSGNSSGSNGGSDNSSNSHGGPGGAGGSSGGSGSSGGGRR